MADRLFGTDGIRDQALKGFLSSENVARLARITGTLLKSRPQIFHTPSGSAPMPSKVSGHVLIARDTRWSGEKIEQDLIAGFRAAGVGVVTVGVIPTPSLATLTRRWGAALGVVISASHNPADDNGIKLISPEGFKIPDEAEAAIEEIFFGHDPVESPASSAPLRDESREAFDELLTYIATQFHPLSLKGLKLVLDCAHGATYRLAPEVMRRLGAEVVVLNDAPTGRNINERCGAVHPEPMAERVRKERAHMGIAFDGDGDRAIVCDETGEVRDGDYILALCAQAMKSHGRLQVPKVVSTVMANYGLEKFLKSIGVELVRTPVGDKYVAAAMIEHQSMLGGEQSGHIIFMDTSTTGDGLITALKVLEVMTSTRQPLSGLCRVLTKMPQVLINVRVKSRPPFESVPAIARSIEAAQKALDGRGRLVLRYSGTEDLVRVMVEAEDPKLVQASADSVADAIRASLGA